jgi:MFS transporter, SP family, sugar:H+ symporter
MCRLFWLRCIWLIKLDDGKLHPSDLNSFHLADDIDPSPLLFFGGTTQAVALFAVGGLGTPKNVTVPMKKAIVALLSIFNFGFYAGWAPASHIISAEIPTSRLRDMTYRIASAVNIFVQ